MGGGTHGCDSCGEEISAGVAEYSKQIFGADLCRTCQSRSKPLPQRQGKISQRELNKRYNFIKGRIAEALVEELLGCLDYQVSRFGMENTVPELRGQLKGKTTVTTLVRSMPDFLVRRAGEAPFLVEVKFRKDGELTLEDIHKNFEGNYPYSESDVLFVLVTKKHIKAITYKDLKEGKSISPGDHRYLGSLNRFQEDKETIIEFCKFAVKFFEKVEDPAT